MSKMDRPVTAENMQHAIDTWKRNVDSHQDLCENCAGSGHDPYNMNQRCAHCDGTGLEERVVACALIEEVDK